MRVVEQPVVPALNPIRFSVSQAHSQKSFTAFCFTLTHSLNQIFILK